MPSRLQCQLSSSARARLQLGFPYTLHLARRCGLCELLEPTRCGQEAPAGPRRVQRRVITSGPAVLLSSEGSDSLARAVAASVPPIYGSALTELARSLPDTVLETIAARENGLRSFVASRPDIFFLETRTRAPPHANVYWVRLQQDIKTQQMPTTPLPTEFCCASRTSGKVMASPCVLGLLVPFIVTERPFRLEVLWSLSRVVLRESERAQKRRRQEPSGTTLVHADSVAGEEAWSENRSASVFSLDLLDRLREGIFKNTCPTSASPRFKLHLVVECLSNDEDGEETLHAVRCFEPTGDEWEDKSRIQQYSQFLSAYCLSPTAYAKLDGARFAALAFVDASMRLPPVDLESRHFFRVSAYVGVCGVQRNRQPDSSSTADSDGLLHSLESLPSKNLRHALREWNDTGNHVTATPGWLERYNVMRLARALPLGDPAPLPRLGEAARLLSSQNLGTVLALASIAQQYHEEPATEGCTEVFRCLNKDGWTVAVAFYLDHEKYIPASVRDQSRADLEKELASVTQALQVARKLTRKPNKKTDAEGLSNASDAGNAAKGRHHHRLSLYKQKAELQRCIAIKDAGPSPLLHPDVLAFAIFDQLPQLDADTSGEHPETLLRPLGQLRYLLPSPLSRTVLTSLRWLKKYPHLFVGVRRQGELMVVRRDVHEELLSRQKQQQARENGGNFMNQSPDESNGEPRHPSGTNAASVNKGFEDAEALYDHNARLTSEAEILQLVVTLLASFLLDRKSCFPMRCELLAREAGGERSTSTDDLTAVPVELLWAALPKPVRVRMRRFRLHCPRTSYAGSGEALTTDEWFLAWLAQSPEVFTIGARESLDGGGRGGVKRALVTLSAKYNPRTQ